MKVLNLRCTSGHGFEGWFASEDDFLTQNGSGLIECPMCCDRGIARMPSAPRLNLSGARDEPRQPAPEAAPLSDADKARAVWLQAVRHVVANTEDVGDRFAEEARRIHYGETAERGIRGQTTDEERRALHDEGIEVLSLPLPAALKGPIQ
jgi:hypothetical protein